MDPICCNQELSEWKWDDLRLHLNLATPSDHPLPQFLTECLTEFPTPLDVSQNNFHLFHLTSIIGWRQALIWEFDLKQSCLSLFVRQGGKMGAEITLVSKVPVELAPVPEKKLERPALLMWIHLRMYAPQRQAIHHYSHAGLSLLRQLQNVQDGHTTLQQPRGNKWHPIGRWNGLAIGRNLFYGIF